MFHCQPCLDRQASFRKPGDQFEFTTNEIRNARVEHADETLQPYREGRLSKEYIDKYGTSRIQATKEEIKNAKPVWNDIESRYYKEY